MRLVIPVVCTLLLAACGGGGHSAGDPVQTSIKPSGTTPAPKAEINYQPVINAWQTKLKTWLNEQQLAGLSVAVVDGDRVVWAEGLGLANRSTGAAANADTLFRVGSISKLFTATAAMQLVERNQWQLDHSIDHLSPGFKITSRFSSNQAAAQQWVTLRRVLSHHAGLPEQALACSGLYDADLLACSNGIALAHAPGEQFAYSNYGIDLVGALLSKHYQKPFPQLVREQILQPLGMTQSGFEPPAAPLTRYAQAHQGQAAVGLQPIYDRMPGGGMWSSANEMSRFMRMALNGGQLGGTRILAANSLAQMWQAQNSNTPLDLDCQTGLGWFANDCGISKLGDGLRVVQHGGSTHLFNAQLILQPEHQLGVYLVVNGEADVSSLARDLLADLLKQKTGRAVVKSELAAPKITQPSAAELARYEGWYYLHSIELPRAAMALRAEQGQLVAQSADLAAPPMQLQRDQDGWYRIVGMPGARLQLQTLAGREVLVAQTADGRMLHSTRLTPKPLSAIWQQRIATPMQLGDLTISWEVQDGLLVLLIDDEPMFIIEPVDDQTGVVAGLGRGRGDVIKFNPDGVTFQGLKLDTLQLPNAQRHQLVAK